jgi:hypothetical protein
LMQMLGLFQRQPGTIQAGVFLIEMKPSGAHGL